VASPVIARCGKASFREAALFTHRGLSGPAILQISSYWQNGEAIGIDFLPDEAEGWLLAMKREQPRASLRKVLSARLPDRLADALCERLGMTGDLGNLSDRVLSAAAARLSGWLFHPNGSEGFAKAEVTVGGISTAELSSKTMEAKRARSLCHRRGRRCDRMAGRVQFPVGLGERGRGGSGDLKAWEAAGADFQQKSRAGLSGAAHCTRSRLG
jgi:predicted flavoprotein YhiN